MNVALNIKRSISDADLATETGTAQTSLQSNPDFPGAEMVAALANMNDKRDSFLAALPASVFGGRAAKAIKNTCRYNLFGASKVVVKLVNKIANGDLDKLSGCGLKLGSPTVEKK